MHISRRQALGSIGLAAFSGVAWPVQHPLVSRLRQSTETSTDGLLFPLEDAVEDRLREDLARLAPRVYSEEGIPVFLACLNLVPARTTSQPAKVSPPAFSGELASTFERNAAAFQRIRPNAQAKDIAQIIEVLADRDFTSGPVGGQ